jgi:macrolide-specific efflux system membrane fusion protein
MFVLSDRLIVKASVDETDIGSVRKGQQAFVSLDAYPNVNVEGTVNHIYYESTIINNVVIYYVDILPRKVPDIFRSGMSANINIVKQSEKNLLTVPYEAVKREGRSQYVLVPNHNDRRNPHKKQFVKTGLFDGTSIEIVEGLSDDTEFLIEVQSPLELQNTQKKNPFLPQRRDNRR